MSEYLKITRQRTFSMYLHEIECLSMRQGYSSVQVDSLRWNRLQLCIDSIETHLLEYFSVYGYRF